MNSVGIQATSLLLVVIGLLFNSIVSSNVYGAFDPLQNKVDIVTDPKYKNDCDDKTNGDNTLICKKIQQNIETP